MTINIDQLFQEATRKKLRFKADNGLISIEDLWEQSLSQLDVIGKALRRKVNESEESLIGDKKADKEAALAELSFEIVKRVIEVKIAEREAKRNAQALEARRKELLEALDAKKQDGLKAMTVEEIEKELKELG